MVMTRINMQEDCLDLSKCCMNMNMNMG